MARQTRRSGNLPAEAMSFIGRAVASSPNSGFADPTRTDEADEAGSRQLLSGLAIRIGTDLARGFPGGACLGELAEALRRGIQPQPSRRN
jgi:hypothetical protein